MAKYFGLYFLALFAVVCVCWAHGEESQNDNSERKMRRIDPSGGLHAAEDEGPATAENTTENELLDEALSVFRRFRHGYYNKLRKDRPKLREIQEQMQTMTLEEREEFTKRRHEQRIAERRREHNGLKKERRHGRRHGHRGNVNMEPREERQEYIMKWQRQNQEPADKLKKTMGPIYQGGPAFEDWWDLGARYGPGRKQAMPDAISNTLIQSTDDDRQRRAIEEEPQVQPTRQQPAKRHRGRDKGVKKAEKKAEKMQFKQEKMEVLQNVLNEMALSMEEFKLLDKQERLPIYEAVKQRLPEREPLEKNQKKRNGKKGKKDKKQRKQTAEMKKLRLSPDFVEELQAIKADGTLTREEKRAQKEQLKHEFKLMTALAAEAATDAVATQLPK